MSTKVNHRPCPNCGNAAPNNHGTDFTHSAVHGIHHGVFHHSPLMLGLGVLAACTQMFKQVRYKCAECGHVFFSR